MRSCFDFSEAEGRYAEWSAREWLVVKSAEVQQSEDGTVIPCCRMGVEAEAHVERDRVSPCLHEVEDA